MVFFCDEGRNAIANAERKTIFAGLDILVDYCKQMSIVRLMSRNYNVVVIKTIAEIVAQEVLRLDAHVEFRMVKINGLVVWVVNGEVELNGVATVENGRFTNITIRDLECGHQAVGRLEMLRHKALEFNPIDLICFR